MTIRNHVPQKLYRMKSIFFLILCLLYTFQKNFGTSKKDTHTHEYLLIACVCHRLLCSTHHPVRHSCASHVLFYVMQKHHTCSARAPRRRSLKFLCRKISWNQASHSFFHTCAIRARTRDGQSANLTTKAIFVLYLSVDNYIKSKKKWFFFRE